MNECTELGEDIYRLGRRGELEEERLQEDSSGCYPAEPTQNQLPPWHGSHRYGYSASGGHVSLLPRHAVRLVSRQKVSGATAAIRQVRKLPPFNCEFISLEAKDVISMCGAVVSETEGML